MVNLVANKQWGKSADRSMVAGKLGLLDSLFSALDEHQMSYHLFDEVFLTTTEELVRKVFAAYPGRKCDYIVSPSAAAARSIPQKR